MGLRPSTRDGKGGEGNRGRMGWEAGEGEGKEGEGGRGNKHTRFKTCGAAHVPINVRYQPWAYRVSFLRKRRFQSKLGYVQCSGSSKLTSPLEQAHYAITSAFCMLRLFSSGDVVLQ